MTATPEERAQLLIAKMIQMRPTPDARVSVDIIAQAIREAVRDELAGLAVHIEHAMDTLTDSERQPSVIGAYVRDWAMKPKTPKD